MVDDGQCKRLIILQQDSSLTFKHFNSLSNSNATKTQNKYQSNDSAASNFTSCPLHYTSRKQIRTRRKVEDAPCEHSDNGGGERREEEGSLLVCCASKTEAECIGFHGELALMWRYGCFCFNL